MACAPPSSTSGRTRPGCWSPTSTTAGCASSSGAARSRGSAAASTSPGSSRPRRSRTSARRSPSYIEIYEALERRPASSRSRPARSATPPTPTPSSPSCASASRSTRRVLDGDEEARLTYLGALRGAPAGERTLVIDIGGGSTELIVGTGPEIAFHASLQAGVVRHTERYLPPTRRRAAELEELADDVRGADRGGARRRRAAERRAGHRGRRHPTSLAAIDLGLDPYDPDRGRTATRSRSRRSSGCARSSRRCRSAERQRSPACTPTARRRSSPAS